MISAAVLTISDRAAESLRPDQSGPAVATLLTETGYTVVHRAILPDEQSAIEAALIHCTDTLAIPLILTTGGTGFSPRDVTPEATLAVCHRLAPGIPEAMRAASLAIIPRAMLSRAQAGIRDHSLIINLPGSPRAAVENLQAVLPTLAHGLEMLQGVAQDCATGRVVSVNISKEKGTQKHPVPTVALISDHGIEGDAHAGPGPRQVSLLTRESINQFRSQIPDLNPGAFAENIVTTGLTLHSLPIGTRLQLGPALCEITQIGKSCHDHDCAIRQATGDCVMPREGVFVRVLTGGNVQPGDEIQVVTGS